jgi:YfiH family protein
VNKGIRETESEASSEVIVPQWPAPACVAALTTTRAGGVSKGAWAGLNLALHVRDDAAHVEHNRRQLLQRHGLPADPVWLNQVHGTQVVELDEAAAAADVPHEADAAWSAADGVVCCVMTADCLPVLLCDTAGTRVGIAHAGWRGLAGGVIEATVAAMRAAAATQQFMAWLGPAISQPAYEVGPEVRAACIARQQDLAAAFEPNANGRWQADLYAMARLVLARCGVNAVYGGDFCTKRDAHRFFSHRREAPCGRMASLIWLKSR